MTDRMQEASIGLTESRPARSLLYPWYDSVWLTKYARAKAIVRKMRPEALSAFEDAFQILHTRPDFQVRLLERIFDDDALEEIFCESAWEMSARRVSLRRLRLADLSMKW